MSDKRDAPTMRPPPNELVALEIDQRADRLEAIEEQIARQKREFRQLAKRMRGEVP